MKKNLFLLCTLVCMLISTFVFAQVPQKFNYQGIARDAKGTPLVKQKMTLKLSVLATSDATFAEYEEIQMVTTNEFGLYTLQIGNGTPVSGEMKSVKWETGNKYIKVAIDPNGANNFVEAGTSQLLSVPYALYADKAGSSTNATHGETRTGAVSSNAAHVGGDANYITKFTALNTIGKSILYDNGSAIGIGTTSPVAGTKIHIYDTNAGITEMRIQHTKPTLGGASRLSFFNDANTAFTATANYAVMNKQATNNTGIVGPGFANSKLFGFNNSQGSLLFSTGGNIGFGYYNQSNSTVTTRLFIDSTSGNVGLGNTSPGAKLEVTGQVKITGGTPGAGKVLTSDATGLASWTALASGPTGPAGATGATGAQGPIGLTGPAGAAGATGPQGVQGAAGANGAQGIQGPAGANGAQGVQGPAGANGAQGLQGPAGTPGVPGSNGAAGATGATGPTGAAGTSAYTAGAGISIAGSVISATGGGGGVSGSGTTNYLSKFTSASAIGNSSIQDNGTNLGIGGAPNAIEKLNIPMSTGTGALSIDKTNTTAGSYATRFTQTGTNGQKVYMNYNGTFTAGAFSAPSPAIAVYTTGANLGIYSITSGNGAGTAMNGESTIWTGGRFRTKDSTNLGASGLVGITESKRNNVGAIIGLNTATNTDSTHVGVYGTYNETAYGVGVMGLGAGASTLTSTTNDIGVYGSADTYGMFGLSDAGVGVYGYVNNTTTGYGVVSDGNFYAFGDTYATGTKSAVVPTSQGNKLVYCSESPEIWFEDFGNGTLAQGETDIQLDPLFLEMVKINEDHPMVVTVTPLGNCNGLYVEPGTTGFKVKELNNGTSNVKFSYRISAKRINFEDKRFGEDPMIAFNKAKELNAKKTGDQAQTLPANSNKTPVNFKALATQAAASSKE